MAKALTFTKKYPETVKQKASKYDEIVRGLWCLARGGTVLHSVLVSNLIMEMHIFGPNGESPGDS